MTNRLSHPYFWSILIFGVLSICCGVTARMTANHAEESWAFLFLLGGLAAAGVFLAILLAFVHRMWDALPRQHARTTPGKAVGFLLIPLFNYYWFFQVFWGWTKDCSAYWKSQGRSGDRAPERAAHLFCLFSVAGGTLCLIGDLAGIPYLWVIGVPGFVILMFFVFHACNALIELPVPTRSPVRLFVIPIMTLAIVSAQVAAVITNPRSYRVDAPHVENLQEEAAREFRIERLREEVRTVTAEISHATHDVARAEGELERLMARIVEEEERHAKQRRHIQQLKADLARGEETLEYSGRTYTAEQVKRDLENREQRRRTSELTVSQLRELEQVRKKALDAAREKIESLVVAKRQLEMRLRQDEQ